MVARLTKGRASQKWLPDVTGREGGGRGRGGGGGGGKKRQAYVIS